MSEDDIRAYKEKAIADDLASIENKLRHAFNQGVELGRKLGSDTQKDEGGACDTCKFNNVGIDAEPCYVCQHNYTSKWIYEKRAKT